MAVIWETNRGGAAALWWESKSPFEDLSRENCWTQKNKESQSINILAMAGQGIS